MEQVSTISKGNQTPSNGELGLNYSDWKEFFDKINFTFFRTSSIQKKYIETIVKYTKKCIARPFGRMDWEKVKIMEIASGSGYTSAVLADLLKRENVEVIFSDLDERLVKDAEKKFGALGITGKTVDAFNLPYNDNALDIIFHQGFLEHFSDMDIISLLQEQSRVAPYVIFDVPNGRRRDKSQEYGNERFLMPREWANLVYRANLRVFEQTARRFTNSWKKWIPNKIYESDWFHKNYGESTIIVCGI